MRGGIIEDSIGERRDFWPVLHFGMLVVAHVTDMNLVAIAIGALILGNFLGSEPKKRERIQHV